MSDLTIIIDALKPYGGLAVIAGVTLVLLRKDIVAVLTAPRNDRAVEALLTGMSEQFAANLVQFKDANDGVSEIAANTKELLDVAKDVRRALGDLRTDIARIAR